RDATAPRCINLNTGPGVLVDTDNIRKVVVMSDHVVAVRTGHRMYLKDVIISICRPQSLTVEWRWSPPQDTYSSVLDMALFQGKLYVLTRNHFNVHPLRLYAMDIVGDNHVRVQCMLTTPKDGADAWYKTGTPCHYLVASGDRLLMAKQKRTGIEVFEAAGLSSGQGSWRKVHTLMGRALFLSEGCSESLPAGGNQHAGAQEDCIYFMSERVAYDGRTRECRSGVYDMRDGTVSPLPFETTAAREGPFTATWFFPADT
uniref:KIB1-4 beta-propeller domain-containing protein n=2 Tax=Aegilops tauschii subsp. strangulata TaxID=200361 RepID=A0A453E091_AEGTS